MRFAISSSVASACSCIAFALKCFAEILFCLFSLAYSATIKVLMLAHVLSAVGLAFHSWMAGSNSPVAFRWKSAMSLLSFGSDMIPFLVSPLMVFLMRLKYTCGSSLTFHSLLHSARSSLVSAKSSDPPHVSKCSRICLGVWFKNPTVSCSITFRYSLSTATRMRFFVPNQDSFKSLKLV